MRVPPTQTVFPIILEPNFTTDRRELTGGLRPVADEG
jgi:hypothetical protein